MKNILCLFLAVIIFACSFGQGEQLYADGTATDQDGNSFEWISYGSQDWAIENAEVVTYRDGTPIPQVTDATEFYNHDTGAWLEWDWEELGKTKYYNWYAVSGENDNDPNTPKKELAPEGWRIPDFNDWVILVEYLQEQGYCANGSSNYISNSVGKAMSSRTGWPYYNTEGAMGNELTSNNLSGFNAFPFGASRGAGGEAQFWTSTAYWDDPNEAWWYWMWYQGGYISRNFSTKRVGRSVRFVRDTSTASTENNQSNTITIYPNPTTSILTIKGSNEYNIKVFDITGRKIMTHTGNTIDMSNLSPATYIIKVVDNSNNEELTYKVIKD